MKKKNYIKPVVTRVILDNSISLVMMTMATMDMTMPMAGVFTPTTDSPFASPFEDNSPFN